MVPSQSSFPLHSRPQTPDSPSLPKRLSALFRFFFDTSLHPYFITSSFDTQDRFQPQSPQSLAHTFRHVRGGGDPCTPNFEFPISYFVFSTTPSSPLSATLTDNPQLHENKATLSPAFATLTRRVKHKSCVCHSYRKHRGWGSHLSNERARSGEFCQLPAQEADSPFTGYWTNAMSETTPHCTRGRSLSQATRPLRSSNE